MLNAKIKLRISVITLFPDIFANHLRHLPISRALNKNLVQIDFINLRNFAVDKRGTVDSPPYGGGPGMILRPEPIFDAVMFALNSLRPTANCGDADKTQLIFPPKAGSNVHTPQNNARIIFLTPRGKIYNQKKVLELTKTNHLIIVCGRYEGMDQRVVDYFKGRNIPDKPSIACRRNNLPDEPVGTVSKLVAEEISIGDYILSGGEVPAMVIVESVVRTIPGAIDNPEAFINESFNPNQPDQVEHPQYSRPEEWRGLKVPKILISGHHAKINRWKKLASLAKAKLH